MVKTLKGDHSFQGWTHVALSFEKVRLNSRKEDEDLDSWVSAEVWRLPFFDHCWLDLSCTQCFSTVLLKFGNRQKNQMNWTQRPKWTTSPTSGSFWHTLRASVMAKKISTGSRFSWFRRHCGLWVCGEEFERIRPNSHRMRTGNPANGTCCCQWECSHCWQATSKEKHSNLRALRVARPVWIGPKYKLELC